MIAHSVRTAMVAALVFASAASADLARSAEAARTGAFGLEIAYTGARQTNFLERGLPEQESRAVVTFRIRPVTGFVFESGGKNDILRLRSGNRTIVRAFLKRKGNGFQLRFKVRDGGRLRKVRKKIKLVNGEWSLVGIDWGAAASAGEENGFLRIRLDGNTVFELLDDLDNGNERVDNLRLGQVSRPKAGWNGFVHVDSLLVRREP